MRRENEKVRKIREISITSLQGWVVYCGYGLNAKDDAKYIEMEKIEKDWEGFSFGLLGIPFFFQVPLWVCPDPLHLQPLPFSFRLGVRLLLGRILPRAAGGVQVELFRSVYLFRRFWGLQVRECALAFYPGCLGCVHILAGPSFFSDYKMISVLENNGKTKAYLHWVKNSVMRWMVVMVAQRCEYT